MEVRLLGTGSADRWPNPWCACPGCVAGRAAGVVRDRTSVLVDDHLLIDPGPDVGARGTDLTCVRTVLVTHDHPDHLDPAFLLAWTWAVGSADLTVAGPAEAVDRCRPWVGPEAPVRFVPLAAGDEIAAGPLRVRALPAAHSTTGGRDHDGTALLYEISGDRRVLYATDTLPST
jgi:adenosylcobinamide kinase/adenosylcobinamide-phosphate guanylyltransferase